MDSLTGAVNQFVDLDLDFIDAKTVKCTFRENRSSHSKYCRVDYEPSTANQCTDLQPSASTSEEISSASDIVTIQLELSNKQHFFYCYRVTAGDGLKMITVVGTFTGNNYSKYHCTADNNDI